MLTNFILILVVFFNFLVVAINNNAGCVSTAVLLIRIQENFRHKCVENWGRGCSEIVLTETFKIGEFVSALNMLMNRFFFLKVVYLCVLGAWVCFTFEKHNDKQFPLHQKRPWQHE